MPLEEIVSVAQGGAVVLLTVAVVALWRRLNTITDSFTTYLKDSADRGDVAAQESLNAR